MRQRKAGAAGILAIIFLMTLFFSSMFAMIFNNINEERISTVVEDINKEVMVLQAKLRGYSVIDDYSYMYENGSRITSRSEMERKKNQAIKEAENAIKAKFEEPRYASQFFLKSIDVNITDGTKATDIAEVEIVVNYIITFRSPHNKEDGTSGDFKGLMNISRSDNSKRTIENPIRQKNLK